MNHQPIVQSLLWYDNEAIYLKFKESAEDPDHFSRPYGAWVIATQKFIQDVESTGRGEVYKIHVGFDEFAAWCQLNRHKQDTRARSAFAVFKAREIYGQRQ